MNNTQNQLTSGGGFSNTFPMPEYQSIYVSGWVYWLSKLNDISVTNPSSYYKYTNSYLNTAVPPYLGPNGGPYNKSGRAYPDVSAIGDNISEFLELPIPIPPIEYPGSGTSASEI